MAIDIEEIEIPPVPQEPPKRGRGRPKGSTNKPKDEQEPVQAKGKKNKGTGQIDPKAQEQLHDIVRSCAAAFNLLLDKEYRMLNHEVDDIFTPLERIVLRHVSWANNGFNPDYVDAAAFLLGVFGYVSRIGAFDRKPAKPIIEQRPQYVDATTRFTAKRDNGSGGTGSVAEPESTLESAITSRFGDLYQSLTGNGAK